MAQDYQEGPPGEKLKESIKNIAGNTLRSLVEMHSVEPVKAPSLEKSIFVTSKGKMNQTIAKMGFPKDVLTEDSLAAYVISFPTDPKASHLNQILWFDEEQPVVKKLETFNGGNFEDFLPQYFIVAEEVSHFLYKDQYFQRHKKSPPDWLVEMIGSLDKYNLMQKMCIAKYERTMNSSDHEKIGRFLFTPVDVKDMPRAYTLAYSRAISLIKHMNVLFNSGRKQGANDLFKYVYTANEEGVQRLLSQQAN